MLNMLTIRVTRNDHQKIQDITDHANDKTFWRRIRPADVITLLLGRVSDSDIQRLKDLSMTNADRIEQRYQAYVKAHGPIAKDEFLGQLFGPQMGL